MPMKRMKLIYIELDADLWIVLKFLTDKAVVFVMCLLLLIESCVGDVIQSIKNGCMFSKDLFGYLHPRAKKKY